MPKTSSPSPPCNEVTSSDQESLWSLVTKADLFRLMDRAHKKSARMNERYQQVEDAIASGLAGKTVDTTIAGDDDMEIRMNSPNITYPPAQTTTPEPTPANPEKAGLLKIIAVVLAIILGAMLYTALSQTSPTPTWNPASLDVNVIHANN
jgi:hypothetical protein